MGTGADPRVVGAEHSPPAALLVGGPGAHVDIPGSDRVGGEALIARIVTDRPGLHQIEGAWRGLASRSGSMFVTPEWLTTWLDVDDSAARPHVIVVQRGDEVVGVLPLVRPGGRQAGLCFPGGSIGDSFGLLSSEGLEEAVARSAAVALARSARGAPLTLANVAVAARWPAQLSAALGERALLSGPESWLPYISLAGTSWEAYVAGRGRNLRSQIGAARRRLEQRKTLEIRRTTTADDVDADMRTFFMLHDRRWDTRGGSGVPAATRQFHERLAATMLEQGWLRLWSMLVDDEPVAAWYGWRLGPTYAYCLSGFDPRWSRERVGSLMLWHTIEQAFAEGAHEYDMLLGNEPYKQRFATNNRAARSVRVVPAGGAAHASAAFRIGLSHAADRLPPGLRSTVRRLLVPLRGAL